jgi:hypothetical protein
MSVAEPLALNLLPLSAAQRTWPDLLLARPVENDPNRTLSRLLASSLH